VGKRACNSRVSSPCCTTRKKGGEAGTVFPEEAVDGMMLSVVRNSFLRREGAGRWPEQTNAEKVAWWVQVCQLVVRCYAFLS